MTQSHIGSNLPLSQFTLPMDPVNTAALFHYDISPNDVRGIRPYGAYVDDSAMLYYNMAETATTSSGTFVIDKSKYGRFGKINGTPILGNGRKGKAMSFDGVNNSVAIPWVPTTEFTVSLWFYKSDWGAKGWETLIGGPSGFELQAKNGATNSPVLYLHSWGAGSTTYELNKWNHVVFTRNASGTKLYLNGVLKLTGTAGNLPAGSYFIGAWRSATEQNFKGLIDKVSIYNRVITDAEINEHYNDSIYTLTGMGQGKYGGAIAVEESTINLIESIGVVSRCTKLDNGVVIDWTSAFGDTYFFFNLKDGLVLTPGDEYTLSFDCSGIPNNKTVVFAWANNSSNQITLKNGRNVLTFLVPSDTRAFLDDTVRDATISNLFLNNFQLERKAFPTSFVYGTRENGRLMYDNAGEKLASLTKGGTISFWYKFNRFYNWGVFFRLRQSPSLAEMFYTASKQICWRPFSSTETLSFVSTKNIGDWGFYTVTWDNSGNCKLYEDGVLKASGVFDAARSGTYDSSIYIGSANDTQYFVNGFIDELRFDTAVRTDDEILSWYTSNSPFYPRGDERLVY